METVSDGVRCLDCGERVWMTGEGWTHEAGPVCGVDGEGDEVVARPDPDTTSAGMLANGPESDGDSQTDDGPNIYTQTGLEAYTHLLRYTWRALKGCVVCGESWCISCKPEYSRVRVFGKTRYVEARCEGWGFWEGD